MVSDRDSDHFRGHNASPPISVTVAIRSRPAEFRCRLASGLKLEQSSNKMTGHFVPLCAIFVPWNFLRRFGIVGENRLTN
jgi:hypothetical protein